jgi:hypothetical protein
MMDKTSRYAPWPNKSLQPILAPLALRMGG